MSKDYAFAAGKNKADGSIAAVLDIPGGLGIPRVTMSLRGVKAGNDAVIMSGHMALSLGEAIPDVMTIQFSLPADWKRMPMMIEARCLAAASRVSGRPVVPLSDGKTASLGHGHSVVDDLLRNYGKADRVSEKRGSGLVRTTIDLIGDLSARQSDFSKGTTLEGDTYIFPVNDLGTEYLPVRDGFEALDAVKKVSGILTSVKRPGIAIPEIDTAKAAEALASVSSPSLITVAYYGDRTIPEQESDDRIQIAKVYPLLAGMIQADQAIRDAVRDRQPVQEMLMEKTGLSKAGLKALSKLKEPLPDSAALQEGEEMFAQNALGIQRRVMTKFSGKSSLETALRVLSELPPDWFPKNDESWKAFSDTLFSMAIPVSSLIGTPVPDLLKSAKGDWVGFRKVLANAADLDPDGFDRRRMAMKTGEIYDMLGLFSRSIVLGNAVRATLSRNFIPNAVNDTQADTALQKAMTAAARIFAGKSKNILASFLEAERVFEAREGDIMGAMMGQIEYTNDIAEQTDFERMLESGTFLVVRDTFVAPNGFVVKPFENAEAAVRIGAFMDHCVGGTSHIQEAHRADNHFYQVYHPDKPNDPYYQGTLMLHPLEVGKPIKYVQFFTFDNGQVIAKKTAYGRSKKRPPPADLTFIDKANGNASGALVSTDCWDAWEAFKNSFTPEMIREGAEKREAWIKFYHERKAFESNMSQEERKKAWEPITGEKMSEPETFNEVWGAWQEVLKKADKAWVSDNSEVLFRCPEARELVTLVNPHATAAMEREAEERRLARLAEQEVAQEAAPAP